MKRYIATFKAVFGDNDRLILWKHHEGGASLEIHEGFNDTAVTLDVKTTAKLRSALCTELANDALPEEPEAVSDARNLAHHNAPQTSLSEHARELVEYIDKLRELATRSAAADTDRSAPDATGEGDPLGASESPSPQADWPKCEFRPGREDCSNPATHILWVEMQPGDWQADVYCSEHAEEGDSPMYGFPPYEPPPFTPSPICLALMRAARLPSLEDWDDEEIQHEINAIRELSDQPDDSYEQAP